MTTDNKAPIEYQLCKLHYGGGTVEHWFVEKKDYDKLQSRLEKCEKLLMECWALCASGSITEDEIRKYFAEVEK